MNNATINCNYKDLDEYSLVLVCQQKDEAAFNELYRRYQGHVHAVLRRLAPDLIQIHEDIVQEVFLRLWRSIDSLRNVRAFKKWLNRLITNLFYNELRRRQNSFVVSIDDYLKGEDGADEGVCFEIADSSARPDEVCERKETIVDINKALKSLPEKYKNVFVLREFHGLPYQEIALRADIEVGTVKSRLSRAKCKLQFMLEPLICA